MKYKTIRVSQITVPLAHSIEQVKKKACRQAGIQPKEVIHFSIAKQSVDARHKDQLKYSYTADLVVGKQIKIKKERNIQEYTPIYYAPQVSGNKKLSQPIAVIGTGPAGLFCAWLLARNGYCPLVFERGKCIQDRQMDVEAFWKTGILNTESNVQFGEGGAGTFSDGKLNTQVKDKSGRNQFVLETFVAHGAPEDILYVNKPHIGTDILRDVVANMRKEIISRGGQFFFSSKVTDFQIEDNKLTAIEINHERWQPVSAAVLAIGHSARDTFSVLHKKAIPMVPKSFAVGMRVEHPQQMINESQYGNGADMSLLPVAAYKLTYQAENGRSVYSFCMCPGGYVVNASSEEKHLAVNGMSYRARDSHNANSAIIVSVTPDDFEDSNDPLCGLKFQQKLETAAWNLGHGRIPQQSFGEFEKCCKKQIKNDSDGDGRDDSFSSCVKGETSRADLSQIFPVELNEAFVEGMHAFARKIKGFDRKDAILSAVESRTSSPVRILRDDSFQSEILGLYPCGEGAGYAGGITSAAMDGLRVAEALMSYFAPPKSEE